MDADNETLKKIWTVELDLLEQFDRFCKTFDLTYYADYGTLLGAVRHRGFIPWDDDIDVSMMRPDYDRLLSLAESYFKPPYFFQHCYNTPGSLWGLSKLINDDTTCIETRELPPGYHHGIFLDVFVLDYAAEDDAHPSALDRMLDDTWLAVSNPEYLLHKMKNGYRPEISADMISGIVAMPLASKLQLLDGMLAQAFDQAKKVNRFSFDKATNFDFPSRDIRYFEKTVMLPYENTSISAPSHYHEILSGDYGDYMTPRQVGNYHAGAFFDPDRPWRSYIGTRL